MPVITRQTIKKTKSKTERKGGSAKTTSAATKTKTRSRVMVVGERQSERLKLQRRAGAGAFLLGAGVGVLGGIAIDRALTAKEYNEIQRLRARNAELEANERRRGGSMTGTRATPRARRRPTS